MSEQPRELSDADIDAIVERIFVDGQDDVHQAEQAIDDTDKDLEQAEAVLEATPADARSKVTDDDREGRDQKGRFAKGNTFTPKSEQTKAAEAAEAELTNKPFTFHQLLREMQKTGRKRDRVEVRRLLRRATLNLLKKAAAGDRAALKTLMDQLTNESRLELDQSRPADSAPQITIVTGVPRPLPERPVPRLQSNSDKPGPEDIAAIERLTDGAPRTTPPQARDIYLGGSRYRQPTNEDVKTATFTELMGIDQELARRKEAAGD